MNKIDQAREMALRAHGDQKYGEFPYSYHLDQVVEICRPYGEEVVIVAYLHDTLEDTSLTRAEIEAVFGTRVAASVEALSDPPGATRKERKRAAHKKLAELDVYLPSPPPNKLELSNVCLALLVKVADRIANVTECIRCKNENMYNMYAKEHTVFRSAVYRYQWNADLVQRIDDLFTWGWPHPVADPLEQARREGAAVAVGMVQLGTSISSFLMYRRLDALANGPVERDPYDFTETERVAAEIADVDLFARKPLESQYISGQEFIDKARHLNLFDHLFDDDGELG